MADRVPLPSRRPNLTLRVEWQGHPIDVTVGFTPDGRPGEVFANTRSGGHMEATLADACVLISIGLQHGIPASVLSRSLGRVPVPGGDENVTAASSPVGAIFEAIREATQ